MLDTWHLLKVKLLFRVLLNSSALLFNELSHFGQVCGKYFCVSQALCLFLSIVLCRSMVPTLTLQIPCNTLKTHPQVKKMVLKYRCLVCFVLESFCDHQWSQYGCVEKVDLDAQGGVDLPSLEAFRSRVDVVLRTGFSAVSSGDCHHIPVCGCREDGDPFFIF